MNFKGAIVQRISRTPGGILFIGCDLERLKPVAPEIECSDKTFSERLAVNDLSSNLTRIALRILRGIIEVRGINRRRPTIALPREEFRRERA